MEYQPFKHKSFVYQSFVYALLNDQTILFQTIQFSINTQFRCKTVFLHLYRTLSAATNPSQSGPGSHGNDGVLCIPQSSSITGTSPPDCLVSYPGYSLVGAVLPLNRDAVSVFYIRLGQTDY